jgi:hypothetical protein
MVMAGQSNDHQHQDDHAGEDRPADADFSKFLHARSAGSRVHWCLDSFPISSDGVQP